MMILAKWQCLKDPGVSATLALAFATSTVSTPEELVLYAIKEPISHTHRISVSSITAATEKEADRDAAELSGLCLCNKTVRTSVR